MGADRICSGIPVKCSAFPGHWENGAFTEPPTPIPAAISSANARLEVRQRFLGTKKWNPDLESVRPPRAGWASGTLLPVLRVMKPVPEHYRFLMVRHQDSLWERHRFEALKASELRLMEGPSNRLIY